MHRRSPPKAGIRCDRRRAVVDVRAVAADVDGDQSDPASRRAQTGRTGPPRRAQSTTSTSSSASRGRYRSGPPTWRGSRRTVVSQLDGDVENRRRVENADAGGGRPACLPGRTGDTVDDRTPDRSGRPIASTMSIRTVQLNVRARTGVRACGASGGVPSLRRGQGGAEEWWRVWMVATQRRSLLAFRDTRPRERQWGPGKARI